MSTLDILEVFIGHVLIDNNANGGQAIDGLLSISWHHPRENVASITTVIPLNSITDKYHRSFTDLDYMERILFKEQRRGTSFFSIELAIVHDSGLFGKVLNALLGVSIGKLPNRYIGAGLKPVLRELKLDEAQTTVIAVANYQLESEIKDTQLSISLKTPRELVYHGDKDPDEVDIDPSMDEVMHIIPAQTEIATVRLDLAAL